MVLLKEWTSSKLNPVLAGKEFSEVDWSSYLKSFISHGGCISDKVASLIKKAELVFTSVRHLLHQLFIRLSITGHVRRRLIVDCRYAETASV